MTLAFVHMERAGGTSIHSYLKQHLRGYVVTTPRELYANEPAGVIRSHEYDHWIRWAAKGGVGGHSVRHWPFLWPRAPVAMTVLRDPVQRFLSHYRHHVDHLGIPWSLEEFAGDRRHWDWQTVRLAGTRDLATALRGLGTFDIVGFTDELAALTARIAQRAGCRCSFPERLNEGGGERALESLTTDERSLVLSANALDLELVSQARARLHPLRFTSLADDLAWCHRTSSGSLRQRATQLAVEAPARRVAQRAKLEPGIAELVVMRSHELRVLNAESPERRAEAASGRQAEGAP